MAGAITGGKHKRVLSICDKVEMLDNAVSYTVTEKLPRLICLSSTLERTYAQRCPNNQRSTVT